MRIKQRKDMRNTIVFAWYPVKTNCKTWVWLEKVMCSGCFAGEMYYAIPKVKGEDNA